MSAEISTLAEDREYAETISADILQWLLERYERTDRKDFKLSECKERFMTISEKYLAVACEFLQQQSYLSIDSSSRIAKYSFCPSPSLSSAMARRQTNAPSGKRSAEKSISEGAKIEEKENYPAQHQPAKKAKQSHDRPRPIPLQEKQEKQCLRQVETRPVMPKKPNPVAAAPAPSKFHAITVTDITGSGSKVSPQEDSLPTAASQAVKTFSDDSAEVLEVVRCLRQLFESENSTTCEAFIAYVVKNSDISASEGEILAILQQLDKSNKIMLSGSEIYSI